MRPLRHPLVPLAAVGLILACTCGRPRGDDADPGLEADADGHADGDTDADTDVPPPCPEYTGTTDGVAYTFVSTEAYRELVGDDGGYLRAYAVDADGAWTSTYTAWLGTPDQEGVWGVVEGWCDDQGWWIAHERTEIETGGADLYYTEAVYPGGCLTWPAGVGQGDAWQVDCPRTLTHSNDPGGSDAPLHYTVDLAEAAEVDVPAGTFDALGVSYSGAATAAWLERDLGTVVDGEYYVLESFER